MPSARSAVVEPRAVRVKDASSTHEKASLRTAGDTGDVPGEPAGAGTEGGSLSATAPASARRAREGEGSVSARGTR